MQVQLLKKKGKYLDKNTGEEKYFTRFYLRCNDKLIPVEPTYFAKKDDKGNDLPDYQFSKRKEVLDAFADDLPDKEKVE